jgi:large subunit ribosomal protein L5
MKRLKKYLKKDKFNKFKSRLKLDNDFAVPRPTKLIVNMGIGEKGKDKEVLKELKFQLAKITGQMPIETRSKSSVSSFGIVEGQIVGLQVTLRGDRMYDFLTKIVQIILPSWKNFKGVSKKSVTAQGNLTIGLPSEAYFPEIDYEKTNQTNGLSLTIVSTANNKNIGLKLFEVLGFVFESEEARKTREEIEAKRREEQKRLAERQKAYKEMAKVSVEEAEEVSDEENK